MNQPRRRPDTASGPDLPRSEPAPRIPEAAERIAAVFVDPPHPAVLDQPELLRECELRTQRRSGPGGQHRNKTSSGAFLLHRPSGVIGEATERRSQAQNRGVALQRLRFELAVQLRTASVLDPSAEPDDSAEAAVRQRYQRHSLKLSDTNQDKPAVLALLLNDLHAAGGQPSVVAPRWAATTSAVVSLLRSHRAAFRWVNQVRAHHDRPPLK